MQGEEADKPTDSRHASQHRLVWAPPPPPRALRRRLVGVGGGRGSISVGTQDLASIKRSPFGGGAKNKGQGSLLWRLLEKETRWSHAGSPSCCSAAYVTMAREVRGWCTAGTQSHLRRGKRLVGRVTGGDGKIPSPVHHTSDQRDPLRPTDPPRDSRSSKPKLSQATLAAPCPRNRLFSHLEKKQNGKQRKTC